MQPHHKKYTDEGLQMTIPVKHCAMLNFVHVFVYHTLVMRACSQFYYISGLSASMGGLVISCDSEDTNHSEKEENGREREVKEGWEGQGRMTERKGGEMEEGAGAKKEG